MTRRLPVSPEDRHDRHSGGSTCGDSCAAFLAACCLPAVPHWPPPVFHVLPPVTHALLQGSWLRNSMVVARFFRRVGRSSWDPAWGVTAPGFPGVEGTYMKWARWLQEYELPITSPGCPFFGARFGGGQERSRQAVKEEMFLSFF